MNELLRKNIKVLPSYDDPVTLGNRFSNFFVTKISKIRESFNVTASRHRGYSDTSICPGMSNADVVSPLSEFNTVQDKDIRNVL